VSKHDKSFKSFNLIENHVERIGRDLEVILLA